jgi:hypothetical protein
MAEPKKYDQVTDPAYQPLNIVRDHGDGIYASVISFPAPDGVYTAANSAEETFLDAFVTSYPTLLADYVEPEPEGGGE